MARRDVPKREAKKPKKKAPKDVASFATPLVTKETEVVGKKRKPKREE